jgi:hypothetical protein
MRRWASTSGPDAAAHGPAEIPVTAAAFARALTGRWLVCGHDESSSALFLARDGIQFTADGRWSLLKADGSGGYENTVNDGTFGSYGLVLEGSARVVPPTDTTPASSVSLHLFGANLELRVGFEVNPRRMSTRGASQADFVRLDDEADEPLPLASKEGERCGASMPCRAGLACTSAVCSRSP